MEAEVDRATLTPNGRMNIWVGDKIETLEDLADKSGGRHTESQNAYIRGVIAGIRMLRDAWLNHDFDDRASY